MSDDEWAFVAPYLTLMTEDAPQRRHDLREVFNALRWIVRAGAPWRLLPHELAALAGGLPADPALDGGRRASRRWCTTCGRCCAGAAGRADQPTAVIFDSRTLQATPESGHRAGYDGHKRRKGSKIHVAVDTLGHLLALRVTPANDQDRAQVAALAEAVQEVTGQTVEVAFVDQGYTGRAGRPRTPRRTASAWRWSSCPRPSAASCCCPGAGWWSAPSPGRRASAAWPGTTNGCRKRWPACISSPSPA